MRRTFQEFSKLLLDKMKNVSLKKIQKVLYLEF